MSNWDWLVVEYNGMNFSCDLSTTKYLDLKSEMDVIYVTRKHFNPRDFIIDPKKCIRRIKATGHKVNLITDPNSRYHDDGDCFIQTCGVQFVTGKEGTKYFTDRNWRGETKICYDPIRLLDDPYGCIDEINNNKGE